MVYNTFIVVKPPPISDPRVFSQPLPHTHTPGFISICFLFPSLPPQPLEAKNLSVSVCSYRSWILQISEIIQHTDFSVWFFSLSAIFFLNIFIFLRTRVFACMYVFVPYARSACGGQKKAYDPRSWRYRWFWAAWCECWEPKYCPVQEQCTLLNTLQLLLPFFLFLVKH